ncbi:MAG: HEAT repeat domain-containing protein, partial [Planctomycetes bacterium]|nr:HEAT repeat domain-containing protein [Planctomycetota bacterium]
MLQGVSSADTHHSANAVVMGPGGWMYWSRGIFNIANFETPTTTFRSGSSGVHRFNPRTFEFGFHFPIGPNPHGDVFDQWGYQFANDGTSGTGSYVNIGKGIGNKKWFQKRVRPVCATGILDSSHFPERNKGNFLICNAIGFLGVLQHKVNYNGADITATEIEPIVVSTDPNFRPSDVEVGGDGALYITDWHNTLIGHMQHNMRDPNRDHDHGRIYRVTAKGRKLLKPAKMKGKPIEEVCEHFFAKEKSTRYRARLELSGRAAKEIVAKVGPFAAKLDPKNAAKDRDEAQALLECLWTFEEQRIVNLDLLKKVFQAEEPKVRAAAIRTLGHWANRVEGWEATLIAASRDENGLVRAEAVKSAVEFAGLTAAEVIFETATRPTDPELNTVLKYAKARINIDALVKDALKSGKRLSPAAQMYVLRNASVADLMKLDKNEAVYRAILNRNKANDKQLGEALTGLAKATKANELALLMNLIDDAQKRPDGNLSGLGKLLVKQPPSALSAVRDRIEELATKGNSAEIKRVGYAAWVAAAGPDDAFLAASQSKDSLRDFLDAVPTVDAKVRSQLYDKVRPLISDLPAHLKAELGGSALQQQGIKVDYFYPSAENVAIETLAKMKPKASGVVPEIVMNVPQKKQNDRFALRFTGMITVPRSGKYTFFTASDDGSRLYIGKKLVVHNDYRQGMKERNGSIDLAAGSHPIIVTYYDHGGGDGLSVHWQGPGFRKRKIAPESLSLSGGETLHDIAIGALSSIPGHDADKFNALASLVATGKHRQAAIKALRKIPAKSWSEKQLAPLADNLLGYLSSMPARYRTGGPATEAIALAKGLAGKLSPAQGKAILDRLQNLDIRVIAIGTVPHRMIFDKEQIVVQAGTTVEFRFTNTDAMEHNFAIIQPGALAEVGELAEATGRDPDAMERHYIPKSNKILLASKLLQPGQTQSLSFKVPKEPGIYPYVCTYPGHWRRMYGALYVVANVEEYQANPEAYLASAKLTIKDELLTYITRNHEWTFEELFGEVKELPPGRAFEVGRQLFKVANCIGCHKLGDEGRDFGPDLAKLDPKKRTTEHILRSIVEPSKEIEEKYQTYVFAMDSGKVINGMILKETPDELHVVIDPLAKARPTILKKNEIEGQKKSTASQMPKGLLNKLSREEIFDLIGYVFAGGKKDNELFHDHKH